MLRSNLLQSCVCHVWPRFHGIYKIEKPLPGKKKNRSSLNLGIFTAQVIPYSIGQQLLSKYYSEFLVDVIRLEFREGLFRWL